VRGGDPALSVDVSIAGVNTLTLKIQDAGDGITDDHGFWSDLRFEEAPASP
jgi:hypothetical protein